MQQRRQRQALAVDHDAHVQTEPAFFLFAKFRFPCFHFENVVAETLRDDDFPACCLHLRNRLPHKSWPGLLTFQHKNRPITDAVGYSITRQLFQPIFAQRLQCVFFQFLVACHAHSLAVLQCNELPRMVGRQDCIAITKFGTRKIQLPRTVPIAAKAAHP